MAALLSPNYWTWIAALTGIGCAGVVLLSERLAWTIYLVVPLAVISVICNTLDGISAREARRDSSLGSLFNGIADRITDVAIIFAVANAIQDLAVGVVAVLLVLGSSYVDTAAAAAGIGRVRPTIGIKLRLLGLAFAAGLAGANDSALTLSWFLMAVIVGAVVSLMVQGKKLRARLISRSDPPRS